MGRGCYGAVVNRVYNFIFKKLKRELSFPSFHESLNWLDTKQAYNVTVVLIS